MNDDKINAGIGGAILVIATIAILGGCCISWTGGLSPNYSNGERVGTLVKASNKGIVFRSWEGELVLNNFGSNLFPFSCKNEEVGQKMNELAGKRVKVKYHQYLIRPINQSTGYTVTSIEAVKE